MALMRGLRSSFVLGTNYAFTYMSSQIVPARTVSLMQPLFKNKDSRLGCQIIMTEELDGIEVRVPATINDARQT
ncbi:PREDICTED: uncharacterized protein LOC105624634 [Atta cephalotes]|uniref:2Fe-2S ferredoxin-type domain-containing protein n=1 Tax=Atta cephalotes TaxID=12957 RepID=A0A158NV22_ATTCE|nr:PREDICTED: uncharacterized protein LOC105624634 [Atta cephalotes]